MDYRRIWKPGGTYFFTVNLLQRNSNALLVEQIDLLRQVVAKVKGRYPFIIHARQRLVGQSPPPTGRNRIKQSPDWRVEY